MTEHLMEHIARATGKDSIDVRIANMTEDSPLRTMVPELLKIADFYNRRDEIDKFNNENRWVKKGIAIVPMNFDIQYFGSMHGTISVFHGDGTVAITTGGIEIGQGLNTKMVQVASHILDIPMDKISVKCTSSFTAPNDVGTVGKIEIF
jgi:xanthine dehydrogenase/oxidase